ncbi:protein kinase domain-containing protein [Puia dinghuensis]|uniref:Protein kinase domain-containing protein n=1 Tax=Puia dinghuensis TaxID=1792502 RepID=A0A8J2XTZ6_9BACT|nr:serine/threonine-protein kinase [Puia dinghuensis]GGB03684.1 hypothetical protein GCM10011511_28720 [Puia dinghuensis]
MLLFNRYKYDPATDAIGKGEFTRVYKAMDTQIYLPVAVKIYQPTDLPSKFGFVQVNKFKDLDHPNICRYLHVGEITKDSAAGDEEKSQVCVMELLPDGNFATYYQARKQPELLRRMVLDILYGLTYLHSHRIVHRRLKPSNLLVGETTQGPVVKITDFGLGSGKASLRDARMSSMVIDVTRMAPEQLNAREYGIDGSVSYHLDFWALGLSVYEALTNNDVLFKNRPGDSREQVIRNILSPRLPEKILRLQAPFDTFVLRCLAKHAEHRPQNTRELLELLAQPILAKPVVTREETEVVEEASEPVGEEALVPVVETDAPTGEVWAAVDVAGAPVAADTPVVMVAPVVAKVAERSKENQSLLNRYEYDARRSFIGRGGFSRVYKAFDKKLGRWVALKFYKPGEYADRYSPIAEIRRVINLDHPNICRYLDIEEITKETILGEKEVTQICVMELLDGGNLLQYYTAHPSAEVLIKLLNDVLKGLAYLHRNGIIHRDIKPANILIKEDSGGAVAKITDFGVSKYSDSMTTNSAAALVVSIPYMAPEQLNPRKYGIEEKISYNLDLWALGVTIYEVITGDVLFKNSEIDSSEEIMANIMAPGLPDKIAALPQPFLEIVQRCLVKDARQRVQQAEELIGWFEKRAEDAAPMAEEAAPIVEEAQQMETEPVTLMEAWERGATVELELGEEKKVYKRWSTGLRITVISATLLLAIGFYINSQNRRWTEVLNLQPLKPDSPHIALPMRTDPTVSATNGEKAATPGPVKAVAKFVLLLSTPRTCAIHINDVPFGVLESGKKMRVYLDAGDYSIQATTIGSDPVKFSRRFVVRQQDLNHSNKYRIRF